MKLGILLCLLFLVVLILPAQPRKHGHGHGHGEGKEAEHGHGHGHGHGRGRGHGGKHHGKHAKKYTGVTELLEDLFFQVRDVLEEDEEDEEERDISDWLFELQEPEGKCDPNPCKNGGVCEVKGKRGFKCDCPEPFKGKRCERARRICKKWTCGRGECGLTSSPPFYECKCKQPFQPPLCRTVSLCNPNPCKFNGTCVQDGTDFDCMCMPDYRGRFCQVDPDDCYEGDGEDYRGNVTETEDGDECLYWNSHFILENGANPFSDLEDTDGLGPHNFCRNPDGDTKPWCFIRKGRKLRWDYCDVEQCAEPTVVPPTSALPIDPMPTGPGPQPNGGVPGPPQPGPTKPGPTKPEPTKPGPTKPGPTKPGPTKPEVPTCAPSSEPATTLSTTKGPVLQPTLGATAEPAQFSTCGIAQPKRTIQRIYGGLKAIPGALPWQVSLQVRPKGSTLPFRHSCGGVLIESCWVLTAGHCIDKKHDIEAVLGTVSLGMEESTEQTLQVEEAIIHENYRETPSAVENDIALLRLKGVNGSCAEETQFVRTACMPDVTMPDGSECTISGWGATEDLKYGSDHLLDAKVLLINQEKCSSPTVYSSSVGPSMFCAGYLQGGVDSCQGDSGGPLTCEQHQVQVIYGLVSWGDQCGRANKPGVYTRVTDYLDWIKSKTQTA
ncbi:hyaluronan-binding protein 2 [Gadus morhua]|uniref:hyaluronan-binding protein 2 n=1 Tax=Gadus morhua TaxID=8049 RepID=UPI0011B66955|nr:hyaluronan-binding protein 2 [Gadus morhua]